MVVLNGQTEMSLHPIRKAGARVLAAVLLVAALLPGAAAHAAATAEEEAAARETFLQELSLLRGTEPRLVRCIDVAFIDESSSEASRKLAAEVLSQYDLRLVVRRTARFWPEMSPRGQADMMRLWKRIIPDLKGHNFTVVGLVSEAARSPHAQVREVADSIVADYRIREAYFSLRKRANTSKGEDRLRAIRTLGGLADPRAAYFLPSLLDDRESGVTEAVYEALGRLDNRAGTLVLKERLEHPSRKHRMLALEALMPLAVIDDLTALYRFAESSEDLEEEVKDDLYRLIARLEIVRDSGIETRPDPSH